MTDIISIIVPVYNCEEFLDRCIASILSQSYPHFELILVDDGSSDNSLDVIHKYSDDQRIKVFSKPNGGASDARNFGIRAIESLSKFIVFIDSDDSVEPTYLEELINNADGQDCVVCNMRDIYGSREIIGNFCANNVLTCGDPYSNQEFLSMLRTGSLNSPCNKLYRTELIKNNHLEFDLKLYNEDISFNIEYFRFCKSIRFVNRPLYNYHHRAGSITSSPPARAIKDYVTLQERMAALISPSLHHYIDDFVSYQYFGMLLRYLKTGNDDKIKSFLKLKPVKRALRAHKSSSLGERLQYTVMRHAWLNLYRRLFLR